MNNPAPQANNYVPIDANFFQNVHIQKLIKAQGAKAIAVLMALLCYRHKQKLVLTQQLICNIAKETLCENTYVKEVIKMCQTIGLITEQYVPATTAQSSQLSQEIKQLKAAAVWLDNLQVVHKTEATKLIELLDEFQAHCITIGINQHENIADAKKHFNNWLRIINNDKNRTDDKAQRRGHVLKTDQEKNYANTF